MRLGRVSIAGRVAEVAFEGDEVVELPRGLFAAERADGPRHPLDAVEILAPVVPGQMLGTGPNFPANFATHGTAVGAREAQFPSVPDPSLKPISGIIGPGAAIVLPADSDDRVFHEPECVAVIGAPCRRVDPAEAARRILGYCCGNDIQHRGWSAADLSPWRSKGQESFSPIGPWIETEFAVEAGSARLIIDDELAWETAFADMVFSFAQVISTISMHFTLGPGDLIWSGTSGGALARAGQRVTVSIDGIGALTNPVETEVVAAGASAE